MEKNFPVEKITWKILSQAIAEAEHNGNGETSLVLVAPVNKNNKSSFLQLFIEEIERSMIKTKIIFSLYGEVHQQNKILQILLEKIKRNDPIDSGGIVMKIDLPFAPVEVKYGKTNGNNGSQQRAFICPKEVIFVN